MDPYMKRKAFTLIELIIVIVVLGILATIAIVGYRAVIDRANQSSAENAAKSFDRELGGLAAFGMEGNPNMTDPNRGQLLIDMLTDSNSSGAAAISKDIPDASTASASLTSNALRALVWNGSTGKWVRLCNATAGCVPAAAAIEAAASATGTVGKVPLGMASATTTATRLCFTFRKGGQTVYLGLSDKANIRGVTSATLSVACGTGHGAGVTAATFNTPVAPAGTVVSTNTSWYSDLGGVAVNDNNW